MDEHSILYNGNIIPCLRMSTYQVLSNLMDLVYICKHYITLQLYIA